LNGFNAIATRTGIGYGINLPQSRRGNKYQIVNNMTWFKGRNSTKWGFDIKLQDTSSDFNPNVRGQLRYSTLTNFVADFADLTAQINKPLPGGQLVMYYRWTDVALYVQHDWKVTPNFTLNLGLRYELPGDAIASLYPVNDRIVASNGQQHDFPLQFTTAARYERLDAAVWIQLEYGGQRDQFPSEIRAARRLYPDPRLSVPEHGAQYYECLPVPGRL
jgi:outer membrane receptor protein involved in Fe transport